MNLTDAQQRVLGCLIEKEMTTPDYYPMTINGLAAACNQKSNRWPVVDYTEDEVLEAVDQLRELGLARTVHGKGDRALKYRHVVIEMLGVTARQAALLAVLMLRGPQTLGELRGRTGRYVEFSGLGEVAAELGMLGAAEEPTVEVLDRRPGEKESRYRHLLGPAILAPEEPPPSPASYSSRDDLSRVAGLEQELAVLQARVARMEHELGLDL